jgi:hypothetical protein
MNSFTDGQFVQTGIAGTNGQGKITYLRLTIRTFSFMFVLLLGIANVGNAQTGSVPSPRETDSYILS